MNKILIIILSCTLFFNCDSNKKKTDNNGEFASINNINKDVVMNENIKFDFSEINITYQHSRRIPYNTIVMNIKHDNIFVKVTAMEEKIGYEYSNFEKKMEITKEYYNTIYQKFININYNLIIDKSKSISGRDGEYINISIGTFQNKLEIELWSINYDSNIRDTDDLITLLKDIFSLFNLENYIF